VKVFEKSVTVSVESDALDPRHQDRLRIQVNGMLKEMTWRRIATAIALMICVTLGFLNKSEVLSIFRPFWVLFGYECLAVGLLNLAILYYEHGWVLGLESEIKRVEKEEKKRADVIAAVS